MITLSAFDYTDQQLLEIMSQLPDEQIEVTDVCGQRYLACGWKNEKHLTIRGTAGNNLGAFSQGPRIVLYGNGQEGVGNTMSAGQIVVHGRVGDVAGYGMRGGGIYIRDDAGYRLGIHMKAFQEHRPVIVVGGGTGAFCGEYMAGGDIIILGLQPREQLVGRHCGTGMYGGAIYLRGEVPEKNLAANLKRETLDREDLSPIMPYLERYAEFFGVALEVILEKPFTRLTPLVKRPFARLYTGFVS